ncbi:MAG: tetratricopeptide repeat protein [Polyangiales bacterium]
MRDTHLVRWGLTLAGLFLASCATTANRAQPVAQTQVDRDVAACRASPARCPTLALVYGAEDARPRNIPAAIRISEAGCELRDGESCLVASGYHQIANNNASGLRAAERGCSLSHGPSCAEVSAIVYPEGPLHNAERALSSSLRACELGAALGCSNHAVALRQFRGPFDPARRDVARFLRQGCREGNGFGCVLLARAMERGEDGIDRDPTRAFELYRDTCDRSAPHGCFEYGQLALRPQGDRPANVEAAARALDAACEGGEAVACRMVAAMWAESDGDEAEQRTAALYGRGCQLEDVESCLRFTVMVLRGQGVAQDVERAAPLLERACTAGSPLACTALAEFSSGVARPDGRAIVRFADRGCELGSSESCALGMRARFRFPTAGGRSDALEYARTVCGGARRAQCATVVNALVYEGVASGNELVPRDVLPLLDGACSSGGNASCVAASSLRLAGLYGIAADPARATGDLIRVCQNDTENPGLACEIVSSLTRAGVGTERDLVRALARARRACDSGSTSGCGNAAFMLARGEGADANLGEATRLQQRECEGYASCARSLDDPRGVAALCRAAPALAVGGSVEGETRGDDLMRASCGALARSPEQVFRLEIRRRETLRVDVQRLSERYDPVLHIRRTCADERSEWACNDDPLPGINERARVERTFDPGTYFIVVDGFGAVSAGRFRLTVTPVAASANAAGAAGPHA